MIYILEFERPLGNPDNPRGQARYYLGYCGDSQRSLEKRLREHRAGEGSALTRAAVQRGIAFTVALTLPGDRTVERQLKNRKNTPRLVRQLRRSS